MVTTTRAKTTSHQESQGNNNILDLTCTLMSTRKIENILFLVFNSFFVFTALFNTRRKIIQIILKVHEIVLHLYENTDVCPYLMTEFNVFSVFHCWRGVNWLIEVDVWMLCFPQGTPGSVHLLWTCVLSEAEAHGP